MSPHAVYLHIGLPKTGTTYIQSSLKESASRLAAAGCLAPGERPESNWRAVSDLLGRRPKGAKAPQVAGSWDALVTSMSDWGGDRVVLSEELLVTAGRRTVRRVLNSFEPGQVHVVVTLRSLTRMLPSAWQQEVKKGRTWTWDEFIAAVRDPRCGPAEAAATFWLRFDAARIIELWGREIPASHMHVVIVPPERMTDRLLLERFSEGVGLDKELLGPPAHELKANAGLGLAEVEVLRRLNLGLTHLNERQYARAVVQTVVPALQRQRATGTPVELPFEHRGWATEKSLELIEFLKAHQYHVVGPLDDLVTLPSATVPDPVDLEEAQLVEPMMEALVEACSTYARYWSTTRKPDSAVPHSRRIHLASSARALRYQAQGKVLGRADNSKVLGALLRAYLKRRSSLSSSGR